jgi:multidrug resistance efflux pump
MATNQEKGEKEKDKGEFEEDFTPKTAKRKINKPMLIMVGIVILLIGIGVAGYFIYEGNYYYQTDNAKVDTIINLVAAGTKGKLVKVYVAQGDAVQAGQSLARVDGSPYIISPIDGTVLDVKLQEGDYVNPADIVLVVAKTSDLYITANVEETNILKIHKGQNVTVSLDAYGRSFDGYVDMVNSVTSTKLSGGAASFTTSGTYTKVTQLIPIKIRLRDAVDLSSIIGTNATVKIRIK